MIRLHMPDTQRMHEILFAAHQDNQNDVNKVTYKNNITLLYRRISTHYL